MKRPCCGVDDGSMCTDDCFRRRFADGVHAEAVKRVSREHLVPVPAIEDAVKAWQRERRVSVAHAVYKSYHVDVQREHLEALRKDPVHVEACCRTAPEVAPGWDEGTMHGCVLDFLEDELDKMLRKGWFIEVIRRYAQHRRDVEQEKRVEQQKHEAAMSVAATGACGYWSERDAIDAVAQRFGEPRMSADEMNLAFEKLEEAGKAILTTRPIAVRVGQRWRWKSGADFTVESICGTNVLLSNGGVFTIEDLLTSPRYEYLGMAAESPDGLKHGTVHRDMPGARPARSVKVALDPKKLKPGVQRDRNVAYAQWFIDECPSWAYPLGWKLAVMAVCEWCGNRNVPAPFTTIWGSGQGAMKLLALYHEARRDGLLSEHAKRKAAHREPNAVEHLICDAYERGRR